MSHFRFFAAPEQVDTCHGPIYVGIGEASDGTTGVGVVTGADEHADIHLTPDQAENLCVMLATAATSLRFTSEVQQ